MDRFKQLHVSAELCDKLSTNVPKTCVKGRALKTNNVPITQKSDIEIVSLFCGAGGLDLGFERAGFKTVWANDILPEACETHRRWSSAEVVCANIKDVDVSSIPRTPVVIGGFPCQGFSLAGPRKIDDSRNLLYKFFVNVVEAKQPDVFVAENVKGILTLGNGRIIKAIINQFADKGYTVQAKLLNAADYGVPQDRMRVIIIGVRNNAGKIFRYPEPLQSRVTLGDVLNEFGNPNPEDVCNAPYSSRYMSRNRRRGWNEVSYTIPAMAKQCPLHPSSPSMVKKGPDEWRFGEGETRRLSWREAAAVQTFPADLEFAGNLTKKYLQIGNAVPVNLAYSIGAAVRKILIRT